MKRTLTRLALMLPLLCTGSALAAERTVTLVVENMTCAACPITVKTAIAAVSGVTSVKVSYEKKSAVVVFDDAKATLGAIAAASTNAGYPARLATLERAPTQ